MTKKQMKGIRGVLATGLVAGAALGVTNPARAHMLGGGGRPSPSSSSSSSGDAWNKIDPATPDPKSGGSSPELDALSADLKKMKAYCDTADPSARQSCLGALAMSASAVYSAKNGLDAQGGQKSDSSAGRNGGPQSKLDRERGAEAERLQAERGRCDALNGLDAEACYEEMRATHEAWHEKHEPMRGLRGLTDFKKLREARAQCLKLKDAKKRRQCLKDLVKKKLQKTGEQRRRPESCGNCRSLWLSRS